LRSDGSLRRIFGAARLREAGREFGPTQWFKLNPNFDLTGITVFHGLQADSPYEYEIGALVSELEFEDLQAAVDMNWERAHRGGFRTASSDRAASRSFVLGSCRYLLRLFGGSVFDDRGDKTFRSIVEQIERGRRTDQVFMLGDQIYADDLNFLLPDRAADEYLARYRDVFSQEHFADLVSRVPTYMTLDDHEIEDNWPARATGKDRMKKFPAAMHAYKCYQLSHSPLFPFTEEGRLQEEPGHFWYRFEDGCCEFFVMDTRTERFYDENENRIRIINQDQMDALKSWLADGSGRVKLIATSVPFFPDLRGPGGDRWDSFRTQRNEILDHIRANNVRRAVFVSGDVHSSMSAELVRPDDPQFRIISVVSSPFFWPYPHSSKEDFQRTGNLTGAEGYQLGPGSEIYSTDSFARVTVDLEELRVEFFKRKGELLGERTHRF
jgi:alkaline phosphatase D